MAPPFVPPPFFQLYVGLISAMGVIANMILSPALPAIDQEFGSDSRTAEWTMTAFMLGSALGQFIWGPLSDRYGRKRPLYWGFFITACASVLAFQANTAFILLLGRFFQGFGATAGNAIARALARDHYEGIFFTQIIARIFTIIPLASGVAPLFGGISNYFFEWRVSFLFMAAFSLFVLGLTFVFLRRLSQRSRNLSVRAIAHEYKILLQDSVSLTILGCIGAIFISFFVFLTSLPLFIYKAKHLTEWQIVGGLLLFPIGIFLGGFYQSVWGWLRPKENVLRECWWIVAVSLALNLLVAFLFQNLLLSYIGLMMFFGGSMSIVNSLSATVLFRRYPPAIAGTLSSLVGVTQTLGGACGSYLVFLTPSPLEALILISLLSLFCYGAYVSFRNKPPEADIKDIRGRHILEG